MEMIHSRSYTYIIKNVYANPSEVLDKIVTDQKILDRAKTVTESYDDFINTDNSGVLVVCGQTTSEVLHHLPMKSKRSRGNFTEDLRMSISWKAFVSMSLLLVLLLSAIQTHGRVEEDHFPHCS